MIRKKALVFEKVRYEGFMTLGMASLFLTQSVRLHCSLPC
jgi:hypothetical protein